jgi:phosphoglycerate dehydrogenase-like enzyme
MSKSPTKKKPIAVISLGLDESIHQRIAATIAAKPKLVGAVDIRISRSKEELISLIPKTEIYFGWRLSENLYQQATNLKWVHLASAGIDGTLPSRAFTDPIAITCSKGIHVTSIAETVFGMILMLNRNLHYARDLQKERRWAFDIVSNGIGTISGKTMGIIGTGHIGKEIARKAKAFYMTVIGINTSGKKVAGFSEIKPLNRLSWLLKESDIVVLSIPLIDKTRGLMGEKQFAQFKPGSILINIARGSIIDEQAMLKALDSGRLAGLGLDVFDSEPLSASSPLWDRGDVLVTPHIAGMTTDLPERITAFFLENLEKYLSKTRLKGVVNKKSGY